MFKIMLRVVSVFALMALAMGVARASADEDARAHFQAIAAGEVNTLMAGYADNARLSWVGGPLDGDYSGTQAIRDVWTKFTKAQGKLTLTVDELHTFANPKGATVTAKVQFVGQANIRVLYVLIYREGNIVGEVWQINPST